MIETIRHNCGICVAHTLHDTYSFIESLQHRGRDATGIAAVGKEKLDVIKWKGGVSKVDLVDLHKIFPASQYHTFMAHVRYATRGKKQDILQEAHPHTIGGRVTNNGDHIIISDCDVVGVHNGQVDNKYFASIDVSSLTTECDTEALLHFYMHYGEEELIRQIPGAYTLAIADKRVEEIMVMRDRTGIRPGVLGWKDGNHCVVSEDIALRQNGGEYLEDLDPGSVYYLHPNGGFTKKRVLDPQLSHCFFEWNYMAHRDTVLEGIYVKNIRRILGETLAKEFKVQNCDIVTFLPRAPEDAARGYTKNRGIHYDSVFFKLRGERAFQGPTSEERRKSISNNLFLLPQVKETLKGKVVVVIDDSTVRGNNIERERLLLQDAQVRKIFHINYTPPIGIVGPDNVPRGCMFGVDISPNDNFIARGRTLAEISHETGIEMSYISVEGLLRAFEKLGMPREHLCTYCIGGCHPFLEIETVGQFNSD